MYVIMRCAATDECKQMWETNLNNVCNAIFVLGNQFLSFWKPKLSYNNTIYTKYDDVINFVEVLYTEISESKNDKFTKNINGKKCEFVLKNIQQKTARGIEFGDFIKTKTNFIFEKLNVFSTEIQEREEKFKQAYKFLIIRGDDDFVKTVDKVLKRKVQICQQNINKITSLVTEKIVNDEHWQKIIKQVDEQMQACKDTFQTCYEKLIELMPPSVRETDFDETVVVAPKLANEPSPKLSVTEQLTNWAASIFSKVDITKKIPEEGEVKEEQETEIVEEQSDEESEEIEEQSQQKIKPEIGLIEEQSGESDEELKEVKEQATKSQINKNNNAINAKRMFIELMPQVKENMNAIPRLAETHSKALPVLLKITEMQIAILQILIKQASQ